MDSSCYSCNAGSEDTHCQVECKLKGALGFKCPFQSHTQMQTVYLVAMHLHRNCLLKVYIGEAIELFLVTVKYLKAKGLNAAKLCSNSGLIFPYTKSKFLGQDSTNPSWR